MTHHEAIERSRRALDHRPDCHHELVPFGMDPNLRLAERWICTVCKLTLSIDPTGVIRDTVPLNEGMMLFLEYGRGAKMSVEQHEKFKAIVDGMVADIGRAHE